MHDDLGTRRRPRSLATKTHSRSAVGTCHVGGQVSWLSLVEVLGCLDEESCMIVSGVSEISIVANQPGQVTDTGHLTRLLGELERELAGVRMIYTYPEKIIHHCPGPHGAVL